MKIHPRQLVAIYLTSIHTISFFIVIINIESNNQVALSQTPVIPEKPLQQIAPNNTNNIPNNSPKTIINPEADAADKFKRYRLGPGDTIVVTVQRFNNLSLQTSINPEGNIVMPLIGTIQLQGLTIEEAEAKIRLNLNKYIINPIITVSLLSQRPVQVTITGEIAKPGYYVLQVPRVSSALQTAGGTNATADLRNVKIRRPLVNGEAIEQTIDLFTPLQTAGVLPDVRLEDGDSIIIPKLKVDTIGNYDPAIVARSPIAATGPLQVAITGEVIKPGFYSFPNPLTISDALQVAKGITASADLRQVRVRRSVADGTFEQIINLYAPLKNGQPLPDFRLANGDVIIIPKVDINQASDYDFALVSRSPLVIFGPMQITVTGEVSKPGVYTLNGPLDVAAVLLNVGGTTTNADLRFLRVRRNLAGGVKEETVDLFTPLKNGTTLPSVYLDEGDTLIVPKIEVGKEQDYDRNFISRSNLAKPTINVRIMSYPNGQIGIVSLPNGSSFADALNGVSLNNASLGDVALIRFDAEQGKAVTRRLDAKAALRGNPDQNVPLQDNDVIVIGRNLVGRITYALGTFTQPFRDILGFLLFFQQLGKSAGSLFGP